MSGDIFGCHYLGGGGVAAGILVGTHQGCCSTSDNAQVAPLHRESASPKYPQGRSVETLSSGSQDPSGGLLNQRLLGPTPPTRDSVVWRGAFPTSSQVMLMLRVQG